MREHIPYYDPSQDEWVEILGTGVTRKVLSTDSITGGDTCYVNMPPDWEGIAGAHYHTGFEEAYMISGDVNLNGNEDFLKGCYLYRPGGIVHGWSEHSINGGRIIIKMGMTTDLVSVPGPDYPDEYDYPDKRLEDGRPHIIFLDTKEQEWTWHDEGAGRYGIKPLSEDADNGDRTYLLHLPAGWHGSYSGDSSRALECAVVHGSLTLEDGSVMREGCYFYRHPKRDESPIAASADGCTALMWSEAI